MAQLVPCSQCNRHVRDATCPFCGARVAASVTRAIGRSSRAAILALAAAAPLAACTKEAGPQVTMYGAPPTATVAPDAAAPAPSASDSSATTPPPPEPMPVALYGAVPAPNR